MASDTAFVRTAEAPLLPPPATTVGIVGWLRANLFSSWFNSLLTLAFGWFLLSYAWSIFDWFILRAVWTGAGREACMAETTGFCWPLVFAKFPTWLYGTYPIDQRWRVSTTMVIGLLALIPMLIPSLPFKRLNAVVLLVVFPLIALILLTGGHFGFGTAGWAGMIGLLLLLAQFMPLAAYGLSDGQQANRLGLLAAGAGLLIWFAGFFFAGPPLAIGPVQLTASGWLALLALAAGAILSLNVTRRHHDISARSSIRSWALGSVVVLVLMLILGFDFGLVPVETQKWGGLTVTLVVSITGIAASLPIGILLALGRRSQMPVVRLFSVLFIELWRGVPLITVLFMSSVMLPLFLPPGTSFDKLLRALIGVGLFSAAYMAEVVRSGLQAIPRGQYEGAQALGLSFWQMMRMIILPQALKISIPNIVGNFISLFKDTTLVSIIGLFDLLGIVRFSLTDANWASPASAPTGYFALALIFWVFCFGMSRYSMFMERRLHAGQKR